MLHFKISEIPELPFKKAVKKKIPIRCCQIFQPFEVDSPEGKLAGKAGDFLMVGVEDELYPCSREIFEQTYEYVDQEAILHFNTLENIQLPFRLAVKKPIPVRFYQVNESFVVDSLEGTQEGKPGDLLMVGVSGEPYICAKRIFEKTYIPLEEFKS